MSISSTVGPALSKVVARLSLLYVEKLKIVWIYI